LAEASLNTFSNNTLNKNTVNPNTYYGIYIDSANSNIFTGNTVSLNDYGIYMPSSGGNRIYNNYFNNTNNVRSAYAPLENYWNASKTLGTNIVGGSFVGGNFWATPSGTGFSETCVDIDYNGICDESYNTTEGIDYLPLSGKKLHEYNISLAVGWNLISTPIQR